MRKHNRKETETDCVKAAMSDPEIYERMRFFEWVSWETLPEETLTGTMCWWKRHVPKGI